MPHPKDLLRDLEVGELVGLTAAVHAELRSRGVLRSRNLLGEYAEYLAEAALGGDLAPASCKSFDLTTSAGERVQVKARRIGYGNRSRQLSAFRSFDFDRCLVVLFDDRELRPVRAVLLVRSDVEGAARWHASNGAHRVIATDALLARGEDITEAIRLADGRSDLVPDLPADFGGVA